jgi:flavin reductase (DIM6/NTAB) family NADH-FMN oxidoreductase RutF
MEQEQKAASKVATSEFVQAMGLHVSSVCVITTLSGGERFGLTATAFSSVTAEPPRVLVCVNRSGLTHRAIASSGQFCANVLGEHQETVAKAFAGMLGRDFDRFTAGTWGALSTGCPALIDATAVFDCVVVERSEQSSHSIFVGEVQAVAFRPGLDTLLYGARRFRSIRKTVAPPLSSDDESLHF